MFLLGQWVACQDVVQAVLEGRCITFVDPDQAAPHLGLVAAHDLRHVPHPAPTRADATADPFLVSRADKEAVVCSCIQSRHTSSHQVRRNIAFASLALEA